MSAYTVSTDHLPELFAALAKAQQVMTGATKDATNPHFGNKYADLASVWDACRGPLADNGLSILQPVSTDGAKVAVTTILAHISGGWIASELVLVSDKTTCQGIGSAITYGRRYGLSAMVGIAPEDDDGNMASGGSKSQESRGSKERQQTVADKKLATMPTAAREATREAEKTMKLPGAETTNNYAFLETAREFKAAIGEPLYRRIVTSCGCEKSNQLLTDKDQKDFLKKLGIAKKFVSAAMQGELLDKVTEDIFLLLPDTAIAAVMNGYREKLISVMGTEAGADEYEALRSKAASQWEFCMACQAAYADLAQKQNAEVV